MWDGTLSWRRLGSVTCTKSNVIPVHETRLIAPCGVNCAVCAAHLRRRNACPGCRADGADKPVTRVRCKMKTCGKSGRKRAKFCFQCGEIPCDRLTMLDKRYRAKYHASPVENLRRIKEIGVREFLRQDQLKWKCAVCGGIVCMHTGRCAVCGTAKDFILRD